jgi:hypothetical protein
MPAVGRWDLTRCLKGQTYVCTAHQEQAVGGADVASFPYICVAAMFALLVEWVSECPNMRNVL